MRVLLVIALLITTAGCQKAYYAGLEQIGIPKRDVLERRVEKARSAQEDTKEQITSALDRFRSTVDVQGGDLEGRYDALRAELEKSEERSSELGKRIDSVESVAENLFEEWQDELDDYQRQDLRRASELRLRDTRRRYEKMMTSMRRAHGKVDPVLSSFRDVVLAMKHELNATAVSQLDGELATIERDVDELVKAMTQSMEEASSFLSSLDKSEGSANASSGPGEGA